MYETKNNSRVVESTERTDLVLVSRHIYVIVILKFSNRSINRSNN